MMMEEACSFARSLDGEEWDWMNGAQNEEEKQKKRVVEAFYNLLNY